MIFSSIYRFTFVFIILGLWGCYFPIVHEVSKELEFFKVYTNRDYKKMESMLKSENKKAKRKLLSSLENPVKQSVIARVFEFQDIKALTLILKQDLNLNELDREDLKIGELLRTLFNRGEKLDLLFLRKLILSGNLDFSTPIKGIQESSKPISGIEVLRKRSKAQPPLKKAIEYLESSSYQRKIKKSA